MTWTRKGGDRPADSALNTARIEKAMRRAAGLDRAELLAWIDSGASVVGASVSAYQRDPQNSDLLREAHLAAEAVYAALTVAVGKVPVPPYTGPPRPGGLGRARVG